MASGGNSWTIRFWDPSPLTMAKVSLGPRTASREADSEVAGKELGFAERGVRIRALLVTTGHFQRLAFLQVIDKRGIDLHDVGL